ncbi:MAG: alpha-L-fucosidase [Candidatus Latescibacteria bacterium]|nr:alpha-L-fucosidase [Candidatus Latescibacterota bacterium]
MRTTATLLVLCAVMLRPATASAQKTQQGDIGYTPSKSNLAMREWFRDAKFGLFVHWGVYSVLGKAGAEWVMNVDKMPIAEYEKLPPQFNPVKFDPDEWCRMVKDAGMKYITITSKHHDGFAMFDSAVSDYDIVDRTPYGKDVLKMLDEACQRHGLKLFFYHSQLDWHHPDYFPRGRTGRDYTGRPESGDWQRYLDYMDAQLRELCTNYNVGAIWFDGMWDKPDADWRLGKTYRMIHDIRSEIMIGSNHHVTPYPGEDFQMFEKGLPGKDPFSRAGFVSDMIPLETCETINNSWGYNKEDKKFKSTKDLIHYLVRAAGNNANFLLNVGPKPDGTIQEEFRDRLAGMGAWMRENGESVYGTRGGPIPPQSWGVTTNRDGKVYLIVTADDDLIAVPGLGRPVKKLAFLSGASVPFEKTSIGTIVRIPASGRDPDATVLVATF